MQWGTVEDTFLLFILRILMDLIMEEDLDGLEEEDRFRKYRFTVCLKLFMI
jgi:hypothetical protein